MTSEIREQADSSTAGSAAPEPVTTINVGPCRCPGTPHGSDFVTLHREMPLSLGVAAVGLLSNGGNQYVIGGQLAELYLQLSIAAWTFTDKDGRAVPIEQDNIVRLLPYARGGFTVSDAAAVRFPLVDILSPLGFEMPKSSLPGPTGDSTSLNSPSGPTHRKHSKRSSRNATAGLASVP